MPVISPEVFGSIGLCQAKLANKCHMWDKCSKTLPLANLNKQQLYLTLVVFVLCQLEKFQLTTTLVNNHHKFHCGGCMKEQWW